LAGAKLAESKIRQVLQSARSTRGVPPSDAESAWLAEVASSTLSAYGQVHWAKRELEGLLAAAPTWSRYTTIGAPTLAAIWALGGDPRDYDSGGASRKGLGLNLKERSSGHRQGPVTPLAHRRSGYP
jgi:hypothetical protein